MTPQWTEDGKPYGPRRYEELVRECYFISKYINTSYNDVLDISPIERQMLLKNIVDELKRQSEHMEKIKANSKGK